MAHGGVREGGSRRACRAFERGLGKRGRVRFSVLLPTRDGGRLIATALTSVLEQAGPDFDVVVADNANADETADVLERFASGPRLRVVRSERVLPVEENWHAAWAGSRGDYLLLMDDDDCLMPGSLERLDELLTAHGHPECLTYNGYSYLAPGVLDERASCYRDPAFAAGPELAAGPISLEARRAMARRPVRTRGFDIGVSPAIVMTVFARRAAERLPGSPFNPGFPDLYALVALLLPAESWVYEPTKLVVGGVSRGSVMDSLGNGRASDAFARLGLQSSRYAWLVAGNELLNGMVDALAQLELDFPEEFRDVELNRSLYVTRQVWAWLRAWRAGALPRSELMRRLRGLSGPDAAAPARAPLHGATWATARRRARGRARGESIIDGGYDRLPEIRDAGEFARWAAAR